MDQPAFERVAAPPAFERVAILGVGLIGGSFGLALRRHGLARCVAAYSRTARTRELAVELGAADEASDSPEACVAGADLVYLATPVETIVPLVAQLLPHLRDDCLLTDAGSTKACVVAAAGRLALGNRVFLGGHPMAGSEQMGVEHATADLFEQRAYALTPTDATPPAAVARLTAVLTTLGARVLCLDATAHDRAVAAISHLPHTLSAALVVTTEHRAALGEPVYELAAGGWDSLTRVAAGGPQLWREILLSNRAALLDALDDYRGSLDQVRALLVAGDGEGLEHLLNEASCRKRDWKEKYRR